MVIVIEPRSGLAAKWCRSVLRVKARNIKKPVSQETLGDAQHIIKHIHPSESQPFRIRVNVPRSRSHSVTVVISGDDQIGLVHAGQNLSPQTTSHQGAPHRQGPLTTRADRTSVGGVTSVRIR